MKLRSFRKSDITKEYLDAINGPQGQYLWRGEQEWTWGRAVKWFVEEIEPDPNQEMFAVIKDGRHIGNIKITLDHKNRSVHYGRLMWKSGTGDGTKALILMRDYVFENYDWVEIITDMAAAENKASIRSNEKAGFRIRGIWEDYLCIGGKRMNGIPVGITRDEWENLKEGERLERWEINF